MTDLHFGAPFADVDEWREEPRRHRYIHGGFEDTETRFSFYFPPRDLYRGRFVQILEGGAGGNETMLTTGLTVDSASSRGGNAFFDLAFDDLGAYLLESNQGHFPGAGLGFGEPLELYGASAESARFSRAMAEEMYGDAPHHGYIGGASGGGCRTINCLEEAPGVYDGGVPFVAGVAAAVEWSVYPYASLMLGARVASVVDATERGGSGDPFAGLDTDQREALAALYRGGFPRGAESQMYPIKTWGFVQSMLMADDPGYFEDFWTVAGYRGHDAPASLLAKVVDDKATVRRTVTAGDLLAANDDPMIAYQMAAIAPERIVGVVLDYDEPAKLFMATLTVLTGGAAGRQVWLSDIEGELLRPFAEIAPDLFDSVEVGDRVSLDNRNWVAYCHYHRHGILSNQPGETVTPEYRPFSVDGVPIYPQRRPRTGGFQVKGTLTGKMILCQATHDPYVWPTQLLPYVRMLEESLGERLEDHFRLWWMEHATHGPPAIMVPWNNPEKRAGYWNSRLIEYSPIVRQAFNDLVRWVEEGVAPPKSTGYTVTIDNAVVLADSAAARGGIQPTVTASANGGSLACVGVGESVSFEGFAAVPPDAGTIVSAEWDFDSTATWPVSHVEADGSSASIRVSTSHTFDRSGTYFPTFRVGSHRNGSAGRGDPIHNLARVRVIVR